MIVMKNNFIYYAAEHYRKQINAFQRIQSNLRKN
jgi:hypothetical protein